MESASPGRSRAATSRRAKARSAASTTRATLSAPTNASSTTVFTSSESHGGSITTSPTEPAAIASTNARASLPVS